jgi:tetratricopeptide (TPR) repeat protein
MMSEDLHRSWFSAARFDVANWSGRTKGLILFGLALLIYGSGVGREFLFDDVEYITQNPLLRRPDAFRLFWFTSEAFNYYPLFWSLLRVQWILWGDHATGFHLVNLLVHSANAVLVWRIGRAWRLPGAWWAGALFAVYPLNVQTIAWAAEQKNTWSFFFMALAVLAFIGHTRDHRWQSYGLSLLCFFAALTCKTSIVGLPFFLAACYGFRREPGWRNFLIRLLPFFVLSVGAGVITLWFEHHRVGAASHLAALNSWQRLEVAGAAFWFYLGKAVMPIHLTPMYRGWVDTTAGNHTAIPALLALLLLLGCGTWWRKIGAPAALGIIYYAVMMFPLLGIFDTNYFVYSLIADHWQYHALPGLLLAATTTVANLVQRRPRFVAWANLGGAFSVLGFGVLASLHFAHFEDARTLWSYVISRNAEAWIAWYNLGNVYSDERDYPHALAAYRESIRIKPDYYRSRFNLANTLAAAGQTEEANHAYLAAQEIRSDDPDAYNNRAVVLLQLGREDEAIAGFNRALQLEPGKASANLNLIIIFLQRGQPEKAEAHLEAAVVSTDANCRRIASALKARLNESPSPSEALKQFVARACELSGNQHDLLEVLDELKK